MEAEGTAAELESLHALVAQCRRCPRLVSWREEAAAHPPARFAGQRYWARPLPGWGDPAARVLVVGLAPAAHGGNRTGRIFTGDRSGDFLFASLFHTDFASQPDSTRPGDGLEIHDMYICAVVRCAPPDNRPLPDERDNCLPYLERELQLIRTARVIVTLGGFAWDGVIRALSTLAVRAPRKPRFGHGAEARVGDYTLVGSYHPSQQNTFTRRLTPEMLDTVFLRARDLAGLPPAPGA